MPLRVREFRQRAGLSQSALAAQSCCSREMISAIENGRHDPNTTRLTKIAQALHVPVWTLFEEEPTAAPSRTS
jgi:transcriptional regulator with XRE-family HTH domain